MKAKAQQSAIQTQQRGVVKSLDDGRPLRLLRQGHPKGVQKTGVGLPVHVLRRIIRWISPQPDPTLFTGAATLPSGHIMTYYAI